MYTKPVLGKAWSQCCGGQEDAVSTNWQSLPIHRITLLLIQLTVDNSAMVVRLTARDSSCIIIMPGPYLLQHVFLLL